MDYVSILCFYYFCTYKEKIIPNKRISINKYKEKNDQGLASWEFIVISSVKTSLQLGCKGFYDSSSALADMTLAQINPKVFIWQALYCSFA